MSLRAVELQITIPRTHDAGKLQEQLQQRPVNDMAHLADEQKKQIEKQQQRANATDKAEKERIKDQQNKNQSDQQEQNGGASSQKKVKNKAQHPYKGHRVDISL